MVWRGGGGAGLAPGVPGGLHAVMDRGEPRNTRRSGGPLVLDEESELRELMCRHYTAGRIRRGSLGELAKPICPKNFGLLGHIRDQGGI